MVQTYIFKMVPGIGFNQDKTGNLLIRYHRNDLLKLRTAFDHALSEIDALLKQPMAMLPPVPIVQNPLLQAVPPQNIVPLPPQAVETMRLIKEKSPVDVSAGTNVSNGEGFKVIEGFEHD